MKLAGWLLSIASAVIVLYASLLAGWWYTDDPIIIAFVSGHSPFSFLCRPDVWQSFSPFNLVPWALLSLKADSVFFGFGTAGYYLHQILSLCIAALALFAVLDLYCERRLFSFLGVCLFLLNPSTLSVSSWLSTRHYIEGMGFALFGVFFYVRSVRGNKPALALISAALYMFAALSKEVYVPLPFLLLLLPEQGLKRRAIFAIPAFLLSGGYTLYRFLMLGNSAVGGYSSLWPWTFKSSVLATPTMFRSFGGSWWIFVIVCVVILWGIARRKGWKDRAGALFRGFSSFLLFYLPVVPVSPIWLSSLRYFFTVSMFIAFCYVTSADALYEKGGKVQKIVTALSVLAVLIGLSRSFMTGKSSWDTEKASAHAEGSFFLDNSERLDAVFRITQPHWFFDGLEKMKERETRREGHRRIRLVVGEFYALEQQGDRFPGEDLKVYAYDPLRKGVADISQQARKTHEDFIRTLQSRPLTVFIKTEDNVLTLGFGPYDGQYIVLEAPPSQPGSYYLAEPISRKFGIKLTHREKIRIFRFAYMSPEGWATLSPDFLVDRTINKTVTWSR